VVKPLSSYDDDDLSARQNVVKLQNRTMVERFADKFQHGRALLVQEHFWGIGVGVEVLCDAGEILFAFQHERVHQPRHGGASSYRKSVPINLELLDAARRIAAELKFTGAMMLEFLYNKQSQEWRFVEINPRFWGSLPLAVAAGANFPLFLYDLLVNQRRDFPQNYQKNVYCRNLVGDLKWCLQNLIYGPRNTTTPTPGRLSMAYEARHALLGREYSDTFALDDMRPGWAELWKYFKRAADNSTAIANRWVLERRLFRHRLHAQAVLKFRSARSINFVCYGNICRSAFAEMYLRKHDGNRRRIASSGIQADDARKSPVTAIIAAEEWDICLADHSATRTHCDSLSESDLIVTFDETIHLRLRRLYPHLSDRMLRFGALATTGDLDIPDPYGKSLEHFRDVYRNIATTLDSILTSTNPASQLLAMPFHNPKADLHGQHS
jgi:protein-tyrosine-phosphatase